MHHFVDPSGHTDERVVPSTPDDLLERIGLGDRFAFSDFYDLFELRVTAMVRSVLVDPVVSLAVAQIAQLEIWQTAPRFDPREGNAASFALTIARSCALDSLRSVPVRRDRGIVLGRGSVTPAVAASWNEVDARFEGAATQPLSPLDHERLVSAYSEAYSSAEIALELSPADVPFTEKMRARLRRRIRREPRGGAR